MIRRRIFCARRAAVIAALALAVFAGVAPGHAAGLDPSKMALTKSRRLSSGLPTPAATRARSTGRRALRSMTRSRRAPISGRSCASKPACTRQQINGIGVDEACSCSRQRPTTRPCGCGPCPTANFKGSCVCRSATATPARSMRRLCRPTVAGSPSADGTPLRTKTADSISLMIVDLSERRHSALRPRLRDVVQAIAYSADGRRSGSGWALKAFA